MCFHSTEYQAPWPRGSKTFYMLKSTEHEIYSAHNVKMPTFVGILTYISRIHITSQWFKLRNICMYIYFGNLVFVAPRL